ncbi:hypothetical protein CC86DRAFT_386368 [Ophiobolus disseminans]|uniref:Uncharacterized protein n=1 Tax=Ophiobolus disseminans TaxID=1469910 RepID=A0A6A6ZK47_9PLEO|nr:hypothetical protein CC86DRAFT_386368 [Ophiobolus disseminans]
MPLLLLNSATVWHRGWSTYLTIYRRNATVVFAKDTLSILQATDLSPAVPQIITAESLFRALNNVLHKAEAPAPVSTQVRSLTDFVISNLRYSAEFKLSTFAQGSTMLSNLLTMPLLIFQPIFLPLSTHFPIREHGGFPTGDDWAPWKAHQVQGSYCRVAQRSVPSLETVIAYAASAGLLVLLVFCIKTYAFNRCNICTSEFSALDYEALTCHVGPRASDGEVSLKSLIRPDGYGTGVLMDCIDDLRIGLRGRGS